MKYKFIILATTLLVCFLLIMLLVSKLSVLDKWSERSIRETKLIRWVKRIEQFYSVNNRLPTSLYEATWFNDFPSVKFKVRISDEILNESEREKLRDPNIFQEETEYALLAYLKGWYVIELKPGKYWKKRLMIDQDGKIYELREIKQE